MSDPASTSNTGEPPSHVTVTPEQFKIDVELGRELFLDFSLTNTSNSLVTFKVKTTARDRYLLRPTQGYIAPHETMVCKIVMAKMSEYPDLTNPKNLKDKFLVQSTLLDKEVPDLTKYWKELETQHNPKAHQFMYAETKIKCKLQIPAKYRAQDAAKRGAAEEAAAAQASNNQTSASSTQSSAAATYAPVVKPTPTEQVNTNNSFTLENDEANTSTSRDRERRRSGADANPITIGSSSASAFHTATAPASQPTQPSTRPSSSQSNDSSSNAASTLQQQLDAANQKYTELMAFVVDTTQKLESERQEKEAAETKAVTANERMKVMEHRAIKAEQSLAQSKEELLKLNEALIAAKRAAEEDEAEGARRRKAAKASEESASSTSGPSPPTASTPITSPHTMLDKPHQGGLSLQFWQIALMALVCFVLGRIFSSK